MEIKRIVPRFTLGSLLLVVVIVALGIAWWLDHARLKRDLINAQTRLTAKELLATQRESESAFRVSPSAPAAPQVSKFTRPGQFIEALRETRDWYEFQDEMEKFVKTSIADDAVTSLIELLENPDPEVRWRALATMGRMARQEDTIVPAIIPLLADVHQNVRWHAAYALGEFGAKASAALPTMHELVERESSPIAAFTVGMIRQIDPSRDYESRLQVFLREGDDKTRDRALESLGGIPTVSRQTEDALLEAFRQSEDELLKGRIAHLLERIEDSRRPGTN
jgi:hypothetical protein